ncbi:MAG: CPCC family cysteine-rich protein [Paludibacter sp.]|nr:CPCC family cysteine-rich protein [Paludibacter sp.]
MKTNKGELWELPPYTCKVCGMGKIEDEYDICHVCGWEADTLQTNEPDCEGGANDMSLNQYRKFWETYKEKILQAEVPYKEAIRIRRNLKK